MGADAVAHGVRVREEEPALDSQDRDPGDRDHVGVSPGVLERAVRARHLAQHGDVGSRGAVEEQEDRHADADEEPRERVEHEHAGESRQRCDEVGSGGEAVDATESGRVGAVEPHERREVHQLDQGGDDHRGQDCLRKVLEQAGQEEEGDDGEHGDHQSRHQALRTGPGVHGGLREAAVHDHPAREARAEVRGTEADQLAVGVDLVVVFRSVGLGRAQSLREADQHHPGGGRGDVEVVREPDVGNAERRQPALDGAHDREPVLIEVEQVHGEDAAQHGDERAGHGGRLLLEPDDDDQGREADEERDPTRPAEVAQQGPELLEEVALALLDPEQLRDLADDDREREPDDEPLHHGLGDEAREEPQTEEPGGQRQDADGERHRDRQLDVGVGPSGGEIAHGRGRQRGRRRHRSHDQLPGAAERRVQEQRTGCRIEADDRRDARDRGVRERFGHEHCPDRQPGDDVAAQPPAVVPGHPAVDELRHRCSIRSRVTFHIVRIGRMPPRRPAGLYSGAAKTT